MTDPSQWPPPAGNQPNEGSSGVANSGDLPTSPIVPGWEPPVARQPVAATATTGGSGSSSNTSKILGIAIVVSLVAGLLGGVTAFYLLDTFDGGSSATISLPQSSNEQPPLVEGSVAEIAATVLPSVVSLEVSGRGGQGSGSGFVLRSDGIIATNNHVIAGAANGGEIVVTFQDGTQAPAEVVGRSKSYDLGIVRVKLTDLPAAALGNSDALRVGDPVVAIGSPLGLNGTVTTGIVSALDRPVTAGGTGDQSFISAIQTDAAINPGNSGGPLLDNQARVIGINSAIATVARGQDQAGSIGLGFAIPINTAKRIAEEILATGKSQTPIIGVTLNTSFQGQGAEVQSVAGNGPAADSGLKAGDIITSVNGVQVQDATELVVAIRANAPGESVTLGIKGKGDVTIKLGSTDDE